jgi:anti-sigma B factor antagonist
MADAPVSIRDVDGVGVVSFRDQSMLDANTVEAVGAELSSLFEPAPQRGIVLDFTNVQFLSSPALSMLLNLRRRADQARCEVVLCGLRTDIARLFRITKLDKLFVFYPTTVEALARWARPPTDQSPPAAQPM